MDSSDPIAKLCGVCSKLDTQRLIHPFHPCSQPLPCSTPPINLKQYGTYPVLGSVDEIKRRRSTCDICRLIADCLDKEPESLDGECRIAESAEFCNFKLPPVVETTSRNSAITHFHLTQASFIFDTDMANQFQGPILPWEAKDKDTQSTHYILNLQAKAKRCGVEAGGDPVVVGSKEEEFLDTVGGRWVPEQVNVQLIRAWLRQCESEHQNHCVFSLKLPGELDRKPTFVIDVAQSCLVETPSPCRYVALSYVWGTATVVKHLVENSEQLRKTDSLQSLPIPATIRDSITLVHAIGERYLWIDSLCIIQDDLKMQQEEIMRMASIYSKAIFTIIAAAGDHANSGLPGVRPGSREQVQKILKVEDCELLTVIDVRRTPSGIDGTTWAQRAWTFQERILSNRVLVFSENQVYWSCRAASHSEERALEEVREIDRLHLTFPQRSFSDSLPQERLEPSEYSDIYDDLLSTYRQRRLTYQSDLLNAFTGVSDILATLQNDSFIWGLPESFFSSAMTWFFTGHAVRNYAEVPVLDTKGSSRSVPFPSWSWAAWSGKDPNNPPFLHGGNGSRVRPVTQFYVANKENQLIKIKERSWENEPGDGVRSRWKNQQPDPDPSVTQHPVPSFGQLIFWTSFANVNAIRSQRSGFGAHYRLFPPLSSEPGPDSQVVCQDFIVIAARSLERLVLLAIEWKDGVAYRTGEAEVEEKLWAQADNKKWRLIILG